MKNLFREKLFQYRAQLALEIPERKLLTGINIATGFSSTPPSADGEENPPSCSYESVFDESTQSQHSSDEDTDDSDI